MDDRAGQRSPPEILFAKLDIDTVIQKPLQYLELVFVDAPVQRGWHPIDAIQLVGIVFQDLLRESVILGFERVPNRRFSDRGGYASIEGSNSNSPIGAAARRKPL